MTKLSDTQLVILSAAAQRDDLSVLPLPETLSIKGGALNKVMDSLRNRGLIRVIGGDGGPERVIITSEGLAAIGVEVDDHEAPATADTAPMSDAAGNAPEAPAPASQASGVKKRAKAGPARGRRTEARTTARATSGPERLAPSMPSAIIDLFPTSPGCGTTARLSGRLRRVLRGTAAGARLVPRRPPIAHCRCVSIGGQLRSEAAIRWYKA